MTNRVKNIGNSEFGPMMDNIPVGLYESTPDGKFLKINTFIMEMFGFSSKEEMLNYDISTLYPSKEDRDELLLKYKNVDKIKNHELKLKRKDGTHFWGSLTETTIKNKNGNIIYFFGILENITEKKAKEEELIKLVTLVEQAAISIILTDTKGSIQYVNPWFEKTSGYKADKIKGENPRILKSKNALYPPSYFKSLWESINNREIWRGQFTNRKKSGEDFIEDATIFPIISKNNKELLGFGAVQKDITRQIELERELEHSLREMETLKVKAESSSKLKSIFLANMSHDIRTPLNAIIGFANLLRENRLNTKLNKYVENIIKSGNVLLNLINDILDLSKIEAGQMSIAQNTFFLNELIDNLKSIFNSQFNKKNIIFRIKKGSNLPEKIFSDQSRVQQILINLLSNALKFTREGEVTLKISHDKQNDLLKFFVTDTGIGIPEESQDKLFFPFYSNKSLDNIDESGTGLGLTICKNLSELLNGNIKMRSKLGEGSEFIFELPANSSEVEDILQLKESNFIINNEEIIEHANKKILIAEDNPANAELLYEFLELKGFKNIHIVNDGEKAIKMALKQLPQLIIMDNKMPKKSGFKALKILREKGFENPIIILTADAIEEIQKDEINIMPESYLTKPINFEFLFEEICRLLKCDDTTRTKNIIGNNGAKFIINKNISTKVKNIFLKDLKEKQIFINKVIKKKNIKNKLDEISIIAHTYKGNAGYFGLKPFELLAKELDRKLKDNASEKSILNTTIALNDMISSIIASNK